jgi:hypothetical protein
MATLGSCQVADQRVFSSDYFFDTKYVDNFAEEVASHQPHTAPMSSHPDASSDPPQEANPDPAVTVCIWMTSGIVKDKDRQGIAIRMESGIAKDKERLL